MPSLTRSAWTTPVMSRPFRRTSPRLGGSGPGQQIDERGLARAVRADQGMPRPGVEPEVDVAHGGERSEVPGEPARLEQRVAHDARAHGSPAPERLADPENAVLREQRNGDEQESQSELPGGGIHLREEVREHHVGDGADEGAVETAGAAEHEDDQDRGGAVEAQRAQVDVGVGLRPDAARDPRDRRRERVADDEPRAHRRPHRVHAQRVLADARQALAERRIHERPHEGEAQEEHAEDVEVLRARVERIELEHREQRSDGQAVEAVEAAGVHVREVGRLLEQRHRAEREHQEGQAVRPEQHEPRAQTDGRRDHRREEQARDGLVPDAVLRQHADRVGAGAEERGVAERDDAGIPEDEIERDREQDGDQDLGAEPEMLREREVEPDRHEPGDRLPHAHPVTPGERERRRMGHAVLRPTRPWGRHRSSRIVSA